MPSRSYRNNNPGNLRWGGFTERRGAVPEGPKNNQMAKWETPIQGLAAMIDLLAIKSYRTLTLFDMVKRYAPSEDNNRPREYAAYVAQRAGVGMDFVLGGMSPYQILKVVEAMIRFENWKP